MSDDDAKPGEEPKHEKKKVTAATTDAPQEEFISPVNRPSRQDPQPDEKSGPEPPRP